MGLAEDFTLLPIYILYYILTYINLYNEENNPIRKVFHSTLRFLVNLAQHVTVNEGFLVFLETAAITLAVVGPPMPEHNKLPYKVSTLHLQ